MEVNQFAKLATFFSSCIDILHLFIIFSLVEIEVIEVHQCENEENLHDEKCLEACFEHSFYSYKRVLDVWLSLPHCCYRYVK